MLQNKKIFLEISDVKEPAARRLVFLLAQLNTKFLIEIQQINLAKNPLCDLVQELMSIVYNIFNISNNSPETQSICESSNPQSIYSIR